MALYVALSWFAISFVLLAMNGFDIVPFIFNNIADTTFALLLPLGTQFFHIYFIYVGYKVSDVAWLNKFKN